MKVQLSKEAVRNNEQKESWVSGYVHLIHAVLDTPSDIRNKQEKVWLLSYNMSSVSTISRLCFGAGFRKMKSVYKTYVKSNTKASGQRSQVITCPLNIRSYTQHMKLYRLLDIQSCNITPSLWELICCLSLRTWFGAEGKKKWRKSKKRK